MINQLLKVDFSINKKNEYVIDFVMICNLDKSGILYNNINFLEDYYIATESTKIYVNDLDKLYIYIIKNLIQNNFECIANRNDLKNYTFSYVYKNGICSNLCFKNKNGVIIYFINFKSKFGVMFYENMELNLDLIEYAEQKERNSLSLGSDAYNEFLRTILPKTRYLDYVAHKIIRNDEHYPIITEYNVELQEAKEHLSGYQFCKQGKYENLIDYDISSSYPAQLLCDTPKGKPKMYRSLSQIPSTYFKIIVFSYMNCSIKDNKINFLNINTAMGTLSLTQNMFNLFIENYLCDIIIKYIIAFKTEKSPFRKFITENIINGKINEPRKHIAKYNKYIGNSIIGYMGRNTITTENIVNSDKKKIKSISLEKTIEPLYLPVYLSVLDRAKSQFIKTIQKYYKNIVYANTDGFMCDKELDIDKLNSANALDIGKYKIKHKYLYVYIECVNGYVGITEDGEIDNVISGMTIGETITPEQYENRQFTYYLNVNTEHGTIKKKKIAPIR